MEVEKGVMGWTGDICGGPGSWYVCMYACMYECMYDLIFPCHHWYEWLFAEDIILGLDGALEDNFI